MGLWAVLKLNAIGDKVQILKQLLMFRLGLSLAISTLAHLLLLIGLNAVITHTRVGDLPGCLESATCGERMAARSTGLPSGLEKEAVYIASILPAPGAPRSEMHEKATRLLQPQEKLEPVNTTNTRIEPAHPIAVWPREVAEQADAGRHNGKNDVTSAVVPAPAPQQGDSGTQGGGGSGPGLPFGGIFGQSLVRPKVLRGPKPIYPAAARREGFEGSALLEILVDRNGKVVDTKMLKSSGREDCDSSAAQTILNKWVFQPALLEGEPVEWREKVIVKFALK